MIMSGRRKPYKPKLFESDGRSNDTSANIYESMLLSEAFQDLTKNQRILYVYMKAQYYGKRKPGRDYPEIKELRSDDLFYFNFSLAEKYRLYSRNNRKQFYYDVHEIEKHGFIKTISNGKSTKTRSVYQFSDEWQGWNSS